jgi:hypothetical protein
MPISPNEMKKRALSFAKEWENTSREEAEAKEFLIQFLNIFDITRRRVATFEHRVKKLDDGDGYIDLLWKGYLLVEMKSKGKDLAKAYNQAKDYCHGLKEYELPKIILICDFNHFHVYDENGTCNTFLLEDLSKNLNLFDVLTGRERRTFVEQDPVNFAAAELMGKLHDKLKEIGYDGHYLELYLVRLLFILFADDTGIFDRDSFHAYLKTNTREDGADLAMHLASLFDVLNREHTRRLRNLDEDLARFPYVNGKLFEEQLPPASFDSDMRKMLLDACLLDWGKISPAIFGSLFQSVMDPKARRNLGAHYTSEKNILKVIQPLFMDELRDTYDKHRHQKNELRKLHKHISELRFLDPACGCGNFLIIAYRELRLLEMDIVETLLEGQTVTDIGTYFLLDVDQFYGIEYEEFPAQIAQVAMWLMDHQMNVRASQRFGDYYMRLPLRKSATIVHGNALRVDWQSLITPMPWEKKEVRFDYIMGNPPFIGKQYQSKEQKQDLENIVNNKMDVGALDYVTGWYIKSAQHLELYNKNNNANTSVAFVSTNSISQGEQVPILWNILFNHFQITINFCHQTFKWSNEAKGNAGVHVVIIGFSNFEKLNKTIFQYYTPDAEPFILKVKNINPYLIAGKNDFVVRRKTPICNVPELIKGNQPTDNGLFLFTTEEKTEFLRQEPKAEIWFKKFIGSNEFINNIERWCLWLKDISPNEIKALPKVYERVQFVREYRLKSPKKATVKKAEIPFLFDEIRHTDSNYLVIPEVSSERRKYIPIGYMDKDVISSNKNYMLPDGNHYEMGILCSIMHNIWIKHVSGRLESRIQYSNGIVYNNFPWPLSPTEKQKQGVEGAAQAVLNARSLFPKSSLADLYDPNTMPPVLVKAHQALDKAVDLCYRPQPFVNETKRIEYLFELYDQYSAGLFVTEKKKRSNGKVSF